ncbi:autotransporter outer membrane beta-barrel domain-containing protein [Caulobacter vibrioides]|uniref:Autotransporter protein n=1 Tax=Caulobacter vibrioides (strain NA1000 / CB15N) TaxID=565050 RepID=A0A0H3C5K7_CAUVN|nr:autotransporter outer membrane beta-barrel domain-containing protein [Caulobacter vibrioides]YP_002515665.2 autotransporter outer membrane beta-barrel domain-containing protein [Caulobacter vibrioides NA1000]ACL93757.2 autotransporter outer membrane beta-barrel domain-containing protein [Caulobacter vibrioides NA1000]QXZ52381.1 autotransporter outer membrane beta-barrel domain-containing protein [Caulobacter vibrioides]
MSFVMQRKVLVATVAAAPLLAMGFAASAETPVSNARTTPIATSTATGTAADDIRITADGSIKPTTAGAIVTIDSNHKVTNLGTLSTTGVNNGVGVLIIGGRTGALTNSATISLLEDYTASDSDSDGDLDGVFAQGANRFGVRLTNAGTFTGNIINEATGVISIEGNNSAGVLLEGPVVGNITNLGSISVTGDNAYGMRIAAPVTGKVTLGGQINVQGVNAVAQAIDANVSGALVLQGATSATGYRYTSRPSTTDALGKLDADDLQQGGPAVRIGGDVSGGLLLQGLNYSTKVNSDGTTTTTTISSSSSGTSSINVFGAAPALQIGSASQNVTLGAVGSGDNAYGLIAKGAISAAGVYNGVSATGVSIGAGGGRTTTLVGGLRNDGQITATSYEANATGVVLNSGATAASILNRGALTANAASFAGSGVTASARGLVIAAGASATSFGNSGSVSATRTGETGDAIAVLDQAGTLRTITNTGSIRATVAAPTFKADGTVASVTATGRTIALDLRANNLGVNFTQSGPADFTSTSTFPSTDTTTSATSATTTVAPSTIGDVLFGAGADTLNLWSGTLLGEMSFGAGQDRLSIDGGAIAVGKLYDTDGKLDLSIANGSLAIANSDTINVSSVNLGSKAKLLFSADPTAGTNTKLVVSGATTIASGAELGIRMANLVKQPTTFTVIQGSNISVGTIGNSLLAESPYLYVATSRTDANNVYIDVRRRTAAEIGFNRAESSAYDAVFSALGADSTLAATFLNQNSRDGFRDLYDQMLPDQGEGLFAALQTVNQQVSAATMFRPDPGDRYGPDSVWVQEINSLTRRDTDQTLGSDTQAFGFVGGYEAMGDAGGALGLTLAYVSIEEHDTVAKVGEQTTASFVQSGAYWRRSVGGWRFNAGGGLGYAFFQGDRRFIAPDSNGDGVADLVLKNSADWNGVTANAYAGMAYEQKFGRFFARPEGRFDYVWLREGKRAEKGGGDAFDLTVDKRTSSNLSGELGVVMGADFGKQVWWRPEVRVGYRQTLAGSVGDTVARFKGGNAFSLAAMDDKQGALTAGFALRAGTPMSYLALEGGVEAAKKQKRYNLRLSGRAMF